MLYCLRCVAKIQELLLADAIGIIDHNAIKVKGKEDKK